MKYEKPVITLLGDATEVVQGQNKISCSLDTANTSTCNAYEADE